MRLGTLVLLHKNSPQRAHRYRHAGAWPLWRVIGEDFGNPNGGDCAHLGLLMGGAARTGAAASVFTGGVNVGSDPALGAGAAGVRASNSAADVASGITGNRPSREFAMDRHTCDAVAALVRAALAGESAPRGIFDLDELHVYYAVHRHRVEHVLFDHMETLQLPTAWQDRLYRRSQKDARQALFMAAQSAQVTKRLSEAAIPHLLFKGAPLSVQTTGRLTGRGASVDVDVLVLPQDVRRAIAALDVGGWRLETALPEGGRLWWAWVLQVLREVPLHGEQGWLDLHWRVSVDQSTTPPVDEMMDRKAMVRVGSVELPTLAPADALIAACYHAYGERFGRLRSMVDVAQLAKQQPGPLPAQVSSRQRQLVADSVALVDSLIGAGGPGHVEELTGRRPEHVEELRQMWLHHSTRRNLVWKEREADATATADLAPLMHYSRRSTATARRVLAGVAPVDEVYPGVGIGASVAVVLQRARELGLARWRAR